MAGTHYDLGKCSYCDNLSHIRCDHCMKYICQEHRIFVSAPNSFTKNFSFCKECIEKRKKPINPVRRHANPRDF